MMEFILPEPVRASLLEYLSQRPYREVADGISALLSLQEIPESDGDTKSSDEG